ncbi:hypothetical protein [Flavobacterium sp. H122]|uniref:DUF6929 family protein n=1 Tax=Flavobacterium sp. H122 TaxID=2529860 RepID=UPI0010AA5E20|nr:hypothetical protein [Flavobacterium sp. H122]
MEKIKLSPFLEIEGIGAASGIVHYNNALFLISDNSGYLFEYDLIQNQMNRHLLIADASVNIEKKRKPDFEAITLRENELHVFGSGSTINRNKKVIFNIDTEEITEVDYSEIYQKIKSQFQFSDDDLNIEGALYYSEKLYLFQRGNGLTAKNGVFTITNKDIAFKHLQLPKIEHVETSFTDAILIEDKIYFLAAAEDTISTYEDGEVLGTIMGIMNPETHEVLKYIQLSPTHKLEGLTLFEKQENQLTFLLCEDNDTEDLNATIYKLTLKIAD